MSIVDEIYAAADRRGIGLADYIRHTYRGNKLTGLERDIQTQLESLRSDIDGFMNSAESASQGVGPNLLCASKERLDILQERVRENLRKKQDELESLPVMGVSRMRKLDESFTSEIMEAYAQEESLETE